MPIEFEFTATPELGSKALRYLLWRRGGPVGPIAMILLPVVIALMAADPAMRAVAYVAAGAAIMLFVLFLLAVAHRRRIRRRFFESNADRILRVVIDEAGFVVKSAAGSSALLWSAISRIWPGKMWCWFSIMAGITPRFPGRLSQRMQLTSSPRK
jgi:hypothetical protein